MALYTLDIVTLGIKIIRAIYMRDLSYDACRVSLHQQ